MKSSENNGEYDHDSIQELEDQIDLCMPQLMAEAAGIDEWNQDLALSFIRRAFLRGKAEGFTVIDQELERRSIE